MPGLLKMGKMGNEIKLLSETIPLQYIFSGIPVENNFKWMLLLGRIIGVSPISVSPRPNWGSMRFSWRSFSTLHSLLLTLMVFVVFVPELYTAIQKFGSGKNILDEMIGIQDSLYDLTLLAVYIFWLRNGPGLITLFQEWSDALKKLKLTRKRSSQGFSLFCLKITLIIMGSCLADLILYGIYEVEKEAPELKGGSFLERFYKAVIGPLSAYLPHYSPFTTIALIYGYKIGDFAWNFTDIFIILQCRALTLNFKEINEEIKIILSDFQAELNLEEKRGLSSTNKREQPFQLYVLEPVGELRKEAIWKGIREKISVICGLSEGVTNFVAPLVLACYEYNIFFVMLNSIRFLYETNTGSSPYVYFSTFQFTMRVVLVTYYAAQVHHSTEGILKAMERYPDSIFCQTAHRLERMLARHPVGVTIGGTVPITRNMFISIMSFLFTAEIVLLQAMSAGPTASA